MRKFAKAGWDIFKINRNNLHENGWLQSGGDHIAHVVKLARKAKSKGYRHIIAAGHSYGGAISLEAGAEPNLFYGLIASAPGHGSDACRTISGPFRRADGLTDQLVEAIDRIKTPRILLTMAKNDECMEFNEPTDALRKALIRSNSAFMFLDDTMPIHGHFAARHRQFATWYGDCIVRFFDPSQAPANNENICRPPDPIPRFLLPSYYEIPSPPADTKSLIGAWSGGYDIGSGPFSDTRNLCLIIETDQDFGLSGKLAYGAGKRRKLNMSTRDRFFAKDGSTYAYAGKGKFRIELSPNSTNSEIALRIVSTKGTGEWSAAMNRGCKLYD